MAFAEQHSFRIFFSWQSDVKGVHSAISKALKKAAKKVKDQLGVDVYIDEATRNIPGSPRIEDAIMLKITECDVFVADVTPIQWLSKDNNDKDIKLSPNPNVMFETGVAVAMKSWNAVVLVAYIKEDKMYELPFDINHNRIDLVNLTKEKDLYHHIVLPINEILSHQKEIYPLFFERARLDINLNSGKYIPDVFIDGYDLRQEIRLFVDPFTFYPKEYESVRRMNFDYVNYYFARRGLPLFKLDLSDTLASLKDLDFIDWLYEGAKVAAKLNVAADLLSSDGNRGYMTSSKVRRAAERFEYASKQIMLVNGTAGQGKTNFLCELTDHILLPREIPFLWINGYEIDPRNFEVSFLKMCLHDRYSTLHDALVDASKICHRISKPLVLIIDGLNEIPYTPRICDNLNIFLSTLTRYPHVRVIMTCREEYFNLYFKHYSFEGASIMRKSINSNLQHDRYKRSLLIENYCQHYGITMSISDDEEVYLTRNLLLLRIFCEVNAGKNIERIDRRKYNLFAAYYDKAVDGVTANLNTVTGQNIPSYEVDTYFSTIIKVMVERNLQYNIPISDITSKLDVRYRGYFEQFLDENILVKRDLMVDHVGTQPTRAQELVSFTYDEFRDFLLARYLVNEILPQNKDLFISIIHNIDNKSISEGLLSFLFIHIFQTGNKEAKAIIEQEEEYNGLMALNVWNVDESKLSDTDLQKVKAVLPLYPMRVTSRLLRRWNHQEHPRLNISILLDYVSGLDDKALSDFKKRAVPGPDLGRDPYLRNKSSREFFFEEIEEIMVKKLYENYPDLKQVFEFLLIFLPGEPRVARIMKGYLDDSGDKSIIADMLARTESNLLKSVLQQWV